MRGAAILKCANLPPRFSLLEEEVGGSSSEMGLHEGSGRESKLILCFAISTMAAASTEAISYIAVRKTLSIEE